MAPLALLVAAVWVGTVLLHKVSQERLASDMSSLAKPGDIFMIASETCPYCKKARAWFKEHDVVYGECLIERDSSCAAAFSALQAPGTPTFVVKGRRLVGFDADKMVEALKNS
jgi:glutaredoxin